MNHRRGDSTAWFPGAFSGPDLGPGSQMRGPPGRRPPVQVSHGWGTAAGGRPGGEDASLPRHIDLWPAPAFDQLFGTRLIAFLFFFGLFR